MPAPRTDTLANKRGPEPAFHFLFHAESLLSTLLAQFQFLWPVQTGQIINSHPLLSREKVGAD